MQTGRKHNMQTMDNSLISLYQRGEITYDTAISFAREPQSFAKRIGDPGLGEGKPDEDWVGICIHRSMIQLLNEMNSTR